MAFRWACQVHACLALLLSTSIVEGLREVVGCTEPCAEDRASEEEEHSLLLQLQLPVSLAALPPHGHRRAGAEELGTGGGGEAEGQDDEGLEVEEGPKNATTHHRKVIQRVHHTWHHDALDGHKSDPLPLDSYEGGDFFSSATRSQWCVLLFFSVTAFLLDAFVFQHCWPGEGFTKHAALVGFWFVMAAVFNIWVFVALGKEAGVEWCSGYFLEWVLSFDNCFFFLVVFSKFRTPSDQRHFAVFVGILGAAMLRMSFFMGLSGLLHLHHWIRAPLGAMLIWTGVDAALNDEEEDDPNTMWFVRAVKWFLGARLKEAYGDDGGLLVRDKDGRLQATLLLLVVFCLEGADIMFAVDSVSAKVAQIPNQFVAFSSTIVAMFGLRAMFFILQDLVDLFHLLRYGLCLILVFLGIELIFSKWLHLPASVLIVLLLAVFLICIVGSLMGNRRACSRTAGADQQHDLVD